MWNLPRWPDYRILWIFEVVVPLVFVALCFAVAAIWWLLRVGFDTFRPGSEEARGRRRFRLGAPDLLSGTPLKEINDARLASIVLMIQLIRMEAPLTAPEKNAILTLMENPLGIAPRQAMYERAFRLTERGRSFTSVAEDLLPLLLVRLALAERLQLLSMLGQVAEAWGEASEGQRAAIAGLRQRLVAGEDDLSSAAARA